MAATITVTVEEKEITSWLSAKEAYSIMDATLTKEAQKYAVEINNEIKEAAKEGKNNLRIDTAKINTIVTKKLIAHLEALGYRVSEPTSYYFNIYWAS